jgi:hypothetical protein
VTDHVAFFHRGHDAIQKMQVGAADGASRDFDDGVPAMLDLGIGHRLAADIAFTVPGERSHRVILRV